METPEYTVQQARRMGARKALKYTPLVFLALEAFILFVETNGDFANGILILFLSSFLFGRWAGRKILVDGKNHILIALLLTLLTWGIIFGYSYLFVTIKRLIIGDWQTLAIIIFLVLLSIWASTAWSIRQIKNTRI